MTANRRTIIALSLGAATIAAIPVIAQRAPTSGPVARYDMRAGTLSGFAAMGGGAGGALSMAFGGGGNKVQKELYLRLGSSSLPAKGAAKAEHFMPANAKLGKSVLLSTPKEERGYTDELPQKPKGRILIFWGCGEHAPKGQPVVIDLSKLAAGQMPPGLWTSTIMRDWGPSLTNSKTFGRWPAEDRKFVKADSSLIGAHRVAGNYSPEIAFSLSKDFMAPLSSNTAEQASGASLLRWNAVPDATGYLAFLFGGKMGPGGEMGDMVMWTSSASRQFGGGLSDWLSPGQVAALVRDRTVMAPATTQCTIPAEVRKAGPDFRMGMLTAFGPEENFAYPERPVDPRAAWNLQWTARIRHRSMTSWMDMPGMAQMSGQQPQDGQQPKCKKKGGLGGIVGGVLGGKDC
ncbi:MULTISPECIES: hypothetical protein [unclassified Novosphingobium]|uniref:hypothetical protein n=1 Tax=unclassified Novosphingobium TaxID=2644732 RepID=UPI0025F743A5|nr:MULTISPECIES: hypothetical protein [unclassified Novosphingobium]HQV04127.1 hypothetical protein [Novosphingobium sp.]